MKLKYTFLLLVLLWFLGGAAENAHAQSIWFRFNGGLEEAYNLSDVSKLTYGTEQNPQIAIHLSNGTLVTYNYADVVSYYFSDNSVSVAERDALNNNRLMIYPNPAGDMATVSWLSYESGPFQLVLRDLKGRIIDNQLITTGGAGLRSCTFNLQQIQSGMYICLLIGKSSIQSTRLIKN